MDRPGREIGRILVTAAIRKCAQIGHAIRFTKIVCGKIRAVHPIHEPPRRRHTSAQLHGHFPLFGSACPNTVILPDRFILRNKLSSVYQPRDCGKDSRKHRSRFTSLVSGLMRGLNIGRGKRYTDYRRICCRRTTGYLIYLTIDNFLRGSIPAG
jgi:hypothetical protein